jgi:hypothetical protein
VLPPQNGRKGQLSLTAILGRTAARSSVGVLGPVGPPRPPEGRPAAPPCGECCRLKMAVRDTSDPPYGTSHLAPSVSVRETPAVPPSCTELEQLQKARSFSDKTGGKRWVLNERSHTTVITTLEWERHADDHGTVREGRPLPWYVDVVIEGGVEGGNELYLREPPKLAQNKQ